MRREAAAHTITHYEETSSADVGAKAPAPAWFFAAHETSRRTESAESSSTEGPPATDPGLIGTLLPAHERLHLTEEFRAIRRTGRWVRCGSISVGAISRARVVTRIGIRAAGFRSAVRRNRAKRLVRVAYQSLRAELVPGTDLLVTVQAPGLLSAQEAESKLLEGLKKLRVIKHHELRETHTPFSDQSIS